MRFLARQRGRAASRPALLALLEVFFTLAASAAAVERNWSVQDFIIYMRRNPLTGARSEELVAIYWNLRIAEREPLSSSEELVVLRARLYSCQVSHIRNRIGSRRPTGAAACATISKTCTPPPTTTSSASTS